jgi:hypothetical protein
MIRKIKLISILSMIILRKSKDGVKKKGKNKRSVLINN